MPFFIFVTSLYYNLTSSVPTDHTEGNADGTSSAHYKNSVVQTTVRDQPFAHGDFDDSHVS